jgi:hypothetical protein
MMCYIQQHLQQEQQQYGIILRKSAAQLLHPWSINASQQDKLASQGSSQVW